MRNPIRSVIVFALIASALPFAAQAAGVAPAKAPAPNPHPPVSVSLPLPCIHSGAYRIVGFILGQKPCPPRLHTPHLSAQYPDTLVWKWNHPDPYRWNFYISFDNGKTYMMPDDYWEPGDHRSFEPDGGSELMYIVGVDRNGNEITRHSNPVRPDDAPKPKPRK